jgi:hypothetical protein
VIKRGIKSIARLANNSLFSDRIELLIVTDEPSEIQVFTKEFSLNGDKFPAEVICVPKNYVTENKTVLKARSLQFSVEYRRKKRQRKDVKSFIFYFDAESTISEDDFRRIIHVVITSPEKRILEGPIVYNHKYFHANVISRQMEASRPYNCYHCVQVMRSPPPLHLHGSNLLVDESIVDTIGWDFGRIKDKQPLLAEDLMFGLKVYLKYGSQPFGWHGGRISEQPPFTVRESIKARMRWITGAWQATKLLESQQDFQGLPWRKRNFILGRIRLRILTHSLSFFAVFFVWMSILIFVFSPFFPAFRLSTSALSPSFRFIQVIISLFFFLPGTIFWIFGILNGSSKNIELLNLPLSKRVIEYGKLLLVTPIASLIESGCVLYATIRWLVGKPNVSWGVTSK